MVSGDGGIEGVRTLKNRFAVGKGDLLSALVLLTVVVVLSKCWTYDRQPEDVTAGDRRLKSACMKVKNAVSLRRAQTVQRQQAIKRRTPKSDMRELHRVRILHQEFITAVDEIGCPELHCNLDIPRESVDRFEWMTVGKPSEF